MTADALSAYDSVEIGGNGSFGANYSYDSESGNDSFDLTASTILAGPLTANSDSVEIGGNGSFGANYSYDSESGNDSFDLTASTILAGPLTANSDSVEIGDVNKGITYHIDLTSLTSTFTLTADSLTTNELTADSLVVGAFSSNSSNGVLIGSSLDGEMINYDMNSGLLTGKFNSLTAQNAINAAYLSVYDREHSASYKPT